MIKLVIVFQSDPFGEKVGGINNFIKSLIKSAPDDFQIEWIGITSNQEERPLLKTQRFLIDDKPFLFTPTLYENDQNIRTIIPLSLRFGLSIRKLKRNWRDSILFFHRIEPVIFFRKNEGAKTTMVHNDILKQIYAVDSEMKWSKIPWLYRIFEKIALNRFSHVLSVSEKTVNYYKETYKSSAIEFSFFPTMVDTAIFCPSIELNHRHEIGERFGFESDTDEPLFLFVGRLQKQKNPILLVESFHAYFQKHNKGKLLIVGEGNMRGSLEELINDYELQDKVLLLGKQDRNALIDLYRGCDALLLTSFFEGMPVCVLESLASGLPVVTADVGEVSRLVKNGFSGEIVDSYDKQAFAHALALVSDNKSVYSKENCVEAIMPYTPGNAALPLYDMYRTIHKSMKV